MTQHEVVGLGTKRAARAASGTVRLCLEVDSSGRILRSWPTAVKAVGLRSSDVAGDDASNLFVADDVLSARALLHRAARGGTTAPVLLRLHRANGTELIARVSAHAPDGAINGRIRETDPTQRSAYHPGSGV